MTLLLLNNLIIRTREKESSLFTPTLFRREFRILMLNLLWLRSWSTSARSFGEELDLTLGFEEDIPGDG